MTDTEADLRGLFPLGGGPYELSHFRHVARTYQTSGSDPDQLRV